MLYHKPLKKPLNKAGHSSANWTQWFTLPQQLLWLETDWNRATGGQE